MTVFSILLVLLQPTTMPARKGMHSRFYNKSFCGFVVRFFCISSIIFINSYENSTIKEDAASQGSFERCETAPGIYTWPSFILCMYTTLKFFYNKRLHGTLSFTANFFQKSVFLRSLTKILFLWTFWSLSLAINTTLKRKFKSTTRYL